MNKSRVTLKVLAVAFTTLLFSGEILAQNYSGCPDITGGYQRGGDNLVIYWQQNNCHISADSPSAGFDHKISGNWTGDHFDFRVSRRNINDGCVTTMYGKLYAINPMQLKSEIYGTDGRCDLPANFTENVVYSKK